MDQKIKTLKIIHLALVAGVTLAFTILGNFKTIFDMVIDNSSLFYAFIPAIAYVTSNFMFKNILRKIQNDASNDEKLAIYQTASIARWAIIEAACFLMLILKPDFLLLGVILLIYLILLAPKKTQIFQTLDIRS
ncbi:MFS transporter [Tenacibaculum sp. FZY0031]|uniref:MFS transporter n=1 Tax=Tenacibaculum sp. FZY0031 TaxID=3116648 RepID=UPI002EBE0F0A|nr:MFS transporter [Tenacibaculum sp. FZY0031]